MKIYLALDGTSDVNQRGRASAAGRIGPDVLVCVLPTGLDPDDIHTAAEWDAIKGDARPALDEWMTAIEAETDPSARNEAKSYLRDQVRDWVQFQPANAGEIRARLCAGLNLTEEECRAWIGAIKALPSDDGKKAEGSKQKGTSEQPAKSSAGGGGGAQQPEPVGPAPTGKEKRPEITNCRTEFRYVSAKGVKPDDTSKDVIFKEKKELRDLDDRRLRDKFAWREWYAAKELHESNSPFAFDVPKPTPEMMEADTTRLEALVSKYQCHEEPFEVHISIAEVRASVQKAMKGWPMRVKLGFLFIDNSSGQVRLIDTPAKFSTVLKEYATVRFAVGRDDRGANYVTMEELFCSFCGSEYVRCWEAVERFPYEPPLTGHYITWRAPEFYRPDGSYFLQFLKMFDNINDPVSRAIYAAAVCTLFWGGDYGKRPCFVHNAKRPRSGKSTAAFSAAELAGNALVVNLDRRSQERLKERWLSDEGLEKRVGVVDNVKGTLNSELMEELVTIPYISGKVLGVGEGSRPNVITYFITANNVKLSPDFARRCFYAEFNSPDTNVSWEIELSKFVKAHAAKVVEDILWILRKPVAAFDPEHRIKEEGFGLWCSQVLARVVEFLPAEMVAGAAGERLSAIDVILANQERRRAADQDLKDAEAFAQGVLERVCLWHGYFITPLARSLPKKPIFLRTDPPPDSARPKFDSDADFNAAKKNNMATYYREIFTRDAVSAKWLVDWVEEHIHARRLPWLERKRTEVASGFLIRPEGVIHYLEKVAAENEAEKTTDNVQRLEDVNDPSDASGENDGMESGA